jgi:hypothetical protein
LAAIGRNHSNAQQHVVERDYSESF